MVAQYFTNLVDPVFIMVTLCSSHFLFILYCVSVIDISEYFDQTILSHPFHNTMFASTYEIKKLMLFLDSIIILL